MKNILVLYNGHSMLTPTAQDYLEAFRNTRATTSNIFISRIGRATPSLQRPRRRQTSGGLAPLVGAAAGIAEIAAATAPSGSCPRCGRSPTPNRRTTKTSNPRAQCFVWLPILCDAFERGLLKIIAYFVHFVSRILHRDGLWVPIQTARCLQIDTNIDCEASPLVRTSLIGNWRKRGHGAP
jgi:hypothetical protein